jgi:hypothetical protein
MNDPDYKRTFDLTLFNLVINVFTDSYYLSVSKSQ